MAKACLGHATAAETLDTYGHLWPDSDDRTRQAASTALWVLESTLETVGTTGLRHPGLKPLSPTKPDRRWRVGL